MKKIEKILKLVTKKQKKRIKLWVLAKNYSEIAKIEGVSRQAVHQSIRNAEKRAKTRLLAKYRALTCSV